MEEKEESKVSVGTGADLPPQPIECDPPVSCTPPTEDDIRMMAYWLWTERVGMGMPSDEKADWRQAEKFLWDEYYARLAENPPV
jgi:hypothetical protein